MKKLERTPATAADDRVRKSPQALRSNQNCSGGKGEVKKEGERKIRGIYSGGEPLKDERTQAPHVVRHVH